MTQLVRNTHAISATDSTAFVDLGTCSLDIWEAKFLTLNPGG